MARNFEIGDDLLFQLESGFGLLRVLSIDESENGDVIWHLLAYEDFFLDPETAEESLKKPENLTVAKGHMALTNRAFERTPTAKLMNREVSEDEMAAVNAWRMNPESEVYDRSALQMLGVR
ncbi:MAG: hypothetical protein KIS76_10010 [Pyrinomonadaceae bacterium]|nr:hypothetical protein [Pyrinomonadaceae bacterium]